MKNILLVEDEAAIADTVIYALQTEGFKVQWLDLGWPSLEVLKQQPVDLIILDVGLPDCNGFDLCKEIRAISLVPIIFLTARNEEVDRIIGLEIGADDYLGKPFSPRELAARVKAVLKRSQSMVATAIDAEFLLDEARATIHYLGQPLSLTRYEYLILKYLLSQPQRVFSRDQIMEAVWRMPETSLERAVDTHIKALRSKLRQVNSTADVIKTHRGLGYSVQGSASES
jgi:two-component system catabolic regulation response regulator CreB